MPLAFHPRGLSRTATIAIIAVVVIVVGGVGILFMQSRPQTKAPLTTTTPSTVTTSTAAAEPGVTPLPDGAKLKADGTLVRPDGIQVKPDGTIVKADGTVVPPAKSSKPAPPPKKFCVDTVLCIRGTHWSSTDCKCVPGATLTP